MAICAKVIIKEALYIALMVDLWVVTGHIRMYEEGTQDKTLWARQREIMTGVLGNLVKMWESEIPFTNIKPMQWAADLANSWKDMLDETEAIDGVPYYKKVDMSLRVIMVLMLPGLLRMGVNMTRQLIQLVK